MPQSVFPCTPAAFSVFMRHHDEGRLLSRSTPDAEIVCVDQEAAKRSLIEAGLSHVVGIPPRLPLD